MSTSKVAKKAAPGADTTWGGTFEFTNNLGNTITNVFMEHCSPTVVSSTGGPYQLTNNQSSPTLNFTTASGEPDLWVVTFIDHNGALWTAQMEFSFHSSSAGSNVELSALPNDQNNYAVFSVTISGSTETVNFNQNL